MARAQQDVVNGCLLLAQAQGAVSAVQVCSQEHQILAFGTTVGATNTTCSTLVKEHTTERRIRKLVDCANRRSGDKVHINHQEGEHRSVSTK